MLGTAKRVRITKGRHHDHRWRGKEGRYSGARQPAQEQIEEVTSDYDKEKLQETSCELAGGVAVIRIWRAYRSRGQGKKDRVRRRAQRHQGSGRGRHLPGGCTALLYATKGVERSFGPEHDENAGIAIVKRLSQRRRAADCPRTPVW